VGAVRRRAQQGGAALLVLHDLALAGACCDRLALLVAGAIAAEGTPAAVLRPEVIEGAYGAKVDVVQSPTTGAPLIAPRLR
jgi:iron complex transport system ATP-binding protein